ncbi:hypothetical protein POH93_26560 [Phytobacter diazotrophicus]|uniref:hypothetical protein n=1 Tax=Phytobacter diazotrophicus TaxID=395631 RepID=UPI00232DF624|nr:hypothetical protein [Phytobacter diazotrophicus]MDC0728923.1 hypothetical protein [Phytobacter diazotrophicus]MDC0736158.1 hypothetical protein [Phytobacter diazotrophicus]
MIVRLLGKITVKANGGVSYSSRKVFLFFASKTKGLPNGKPLFNLAEAQSAKLMSENVRNRPFLPLINNMLSKSIVRGRLAPSEKI